MMILSQQLGPDTLFSAEKLTLIGTLSAVIWAIMTQRLVPGVFYDDLKRENERLRRALDQWRETGRTFAGTAKELASRQTQVNAEAIEAAYDKADCDPEPNDPHSPDADAH